jgi:hypothetical protein
MSASPTKPITHALAEALAETAPGAEQSNLRRIVDNLIAKGIDGDLPAIREIFDRIDGKAPAAGASASAEPPEKVRFEWKSDQ